MHIAHAMSGEKFVRQTPRFYDQQRDRCKELRVPIQKRIENIDNYVAERPPVIDRRLPALGAPPPRQLRPAVLAMCQRRPLSIFAPAEKASVGRSLNGRNGRIAQDKLGRFVGHLRCQTMKTHSERPFRIVEWFRFSIDRVLLYEPNQDRHRNLRLTSKSR